MSKVALLRIGQWFGRRLEPTIAEMLSDSIVRAVMDADGIDPVALEMELNSMAHKLDAVRHTARGTAHRNGIMAPRMRRAT